MPALAYRCLSARCSVGMRGHRARSRGCSSLQTPDEIVEGLVDDGLTALVNDLCVEVEVLRGDDRTIDRGSLSCGVHRAGIDADRDGVSALNDCLRVR